VPRLRVFTPKELEEAFISALETYKAAKEIVVYALLDSIKVTVTEEWSEIVTTEPWISFYLFNDGPDEVYLSVNKKVPIEKIESPLEKGEDFNMDAKKPVINAVYLICKPGKSATVRMWLKR